MCPTHHAAFDTYQFFIRYIPHAKRYVFVNYSGHPDYKDYHGKAVALEAHHRHAPFPSLFIIHEMRVRGFHPFQPVNPDIGLAYPFQEWIVAGDLFDEASSSFKHNTSDAQHNPSEGSDTEMEVPTTPPQDGGASDSLPALNRNNIADILAATYSLPSWKACVVDGTSWNGTAEENIQRYHELLTEPTQKKPMTITGI